MTETGRHPKNFRLLATVVKTKMRATRMMHFRQTMWSANIDTKTELGWAQNPVVLGMVPDKVNRKALVVMEPSYMMQHIGLKRRVSLGVENLSVMVPHRNHYCICQMLLIKISGFTQKSLL